MEPILEAFTTHPEEQQAQMEVDFQDINALATEGGIVVIKFFWPGTLNARSPVCA